MEPSTIPTNQSLSPVTHGICYNISIPESWFRVFAKKKKNPSTKTKRNLQFSQSRALSQTQFYTLSFLTPPCKHQGRQRCEWKVPIQGRVLHEFTPTQLQEGGWDPILAGRGRGIGGSVCETQASGTWCQRPGTRDHLHVTGKETEPDLLRPASCHPRL